MSFLSFRGVGFIRRADVAVAMAGLLAATSGCTLIMGAGGAVVDSALITSPVWAPGIVNVHKLDNVQEDVLLPPGCDSGKAAFQTIPAAEDVDVFVRPFAGPPEYARPRARYWTWLTMIPLMPYANQRADVRTLEKSAVPAEFNGRSSGGSVEVRFPLNRLPESLRTRATDGFVGDRREAALAIASGELSAKEPSPDDFLAAYCDSTRDDYRMGLTGFVRDALQKNLPENRVSLQIPQLAGRCAMKVAERDGRQAKVTLSGEDNDATRGVTFGVYGDDCVATIPPEALRVKGTAGEFASLNDRQVLITGQVRSLRLEVSDIAYGVTALGAHLLSFFGLPLSSSRLVMEVDVKAWRGGEPTPAAERTLLIETDRNTVGLYYGGDFAGKLHDELMERLEGEIAAFARDLRPIVAKSRSVASAPPTPPSAAAAFSEDRP